MCGLVPGLFWSLALQSWHFSAIPACAKGTWQLSTPPWDAQTLPGPSTGAAGLCQNWGHSILVVPPKAERALDRGSGLGDYFCYPAEGFCMALFLLQEQICAAEPTDF